MKTDITFGQYHKTIESPEGIDLVGITVKYDENCFCVMANLDNPKLTVSEETIVLNNKTSVILHNYASRGLNEIIPEFANFKGMKISEIKFENLYIFQTI